jgi:hypothetical protein
VRHVFPCCIGARSVGNRVKERNVLHVHVVVPACLLYSAFIIAHRRALSLVLSMCNGITHALYRVPTLKHDMLVNCILMFGIVQGIF